MLTYVLVAVVCATAVALWRWTGSRPSRQTKALRPIAVAIALGVPFQAVIGGITVLTNLNPWVVALHLMLSMVLVALSTWLVCGVVREIDANSYQDSPGAISGLGAATYAAVWVVTYLGTIVTGAGPHAGDAEAPRNGLDPESVSQLHSAAVFVLIALTASLAWTKRGKVTGKAALVVLGVELAQGVIGYVQYVTDLPIGLVTAHLLGAATLMVAATRLVFIDYFQPRNGSAAAATNNSAK